ncbi:DUF4291 domain-containing protein [Saccharopolyspora indica]|uniref:DUF4291 domain-containing protein n=1 Tax=Saccharopolyspora indica TaxID=1229659 RepID=UPI0022EA7979|nr:DUF4291 domain-containing protein [Saccharopolyspora indica]MDA3643571.1 DUF4291 domain-containing protein [Saccharopolyspora indica]
MKDRESTEYRAVRAQHTATSITVYQAYSAEIADAALAAGTFAPPFKRERMTWIKPSFRWMAYRCGWATKPNQERVLAVEITREGFERALEHASLSHFEPDTHGTREQWAEQQRTSPVRVQWDPERDLHLRPLGHRSIQIGLGGEAVHHYVDDWIVALTDVTPAMRETAELVAAGDLEAARASLPKEDPYPLPENIARRLGATG